MGDLKNLDMTELRGFASEFRSLLYQFPFQIPANLLFLGRALGILSGLATQIDPHFNVFASAVPFAEKMIADETGSFFRSALDQTIEIGKAIVRLPVQADRLIDMLVRGEVRFAVNDTDRLIKEMHNMNRSMIRLQWTLISLGLLLTSLALDLAGHTSVSPIAFGAAIIAAIWFVIRGLIG
jgi:predicted unusual protein kinase regulating ubiquinone biosynthesis (AarF/ABC1/UbiB family)